MRGFDPSGSVMASSDAVRGFLTALDVPPQRMPASTDAQASLYRSLLSGKRMLVVLDNARDAEHVRALLPGAPGCFVVVTSRRELTSLVAVEGAHAITLDVLSHDEAAQLLGDRLGSSRIEAEPEAVNEIIGRCARLPLALAIVAARAAMHSRFPISVFVKQLLDMQSRLNALAAGDAFTDIRAVFSWSYRTIESVDAQRLFRLLGLHPGPDVALPAAASLLGVPVVHVVPLLAELTQAHLLAEPTPGRYTFHDLLRAYASELAGIHDTPAEQRAAIHRMLDHYLHAAHDGDLLLRPHQDTRITLDSPQSGVAPENLGSSADAMAWFAAEDSVLLATVDRAANEGFHVHGWQLASFLSNFLHRRGNWHQWAESHRTGLDCAARLNDVSGQAIMHRGLGYAYAELGRLDDAHRQLEQALTHFAAALDQAGQAHTHHGLGGICERRGQYRQALNHARHAHDLHQSTGSQAGQADALNAIGWCHAMLGEHEHALTSCEQARILNHEIGNHDGEAVAWDSLGYTHHQLGQHAQAIACYDRALQLFQQLEDRYYEATVLTHLGDSKHAIDDRAGAVDAWQQARTILEELSHADAEQVRLKLQNVDKLAETIAAPTADQSL
ncbi:hypothetical protein Rhe02_84040 [Rhizocola hellebori]|uniref:NB-ARC domain-containing protein n=2 Tax=Rhizocola hellebori TaxID=1392758 RepID=A0A8J3QHW5_9ACTN|nr:hypothetical protein Rhe02_84040 [Rhizocola hellebori]